MYPKNSATPPILTVGSIYLIADGTIQTSGASVRVKTGAGAWGAGGGTLAYDTTGGAITYTPTQAETNDEEFQVTVYKASCTSASITVITTAGSTAGEVTVTDKTGFALSATGMDAVTLPADIITAASINTGAFSADAFAANALVAATFAASSLNGKGDWNTTTPPTAAAIVDEWETQSQADPTGFHVNVYEIKDQLMAASNPITVNAVVGAPTQTATALAVVALQNDMDLVPKSTGTESWNATALAAIQSEANDALVALNLDHLCKTATAGADMTTEVVDNTILSRILANGDTSAFDPSTDGLQPIRDRGDSAWVTATSVTVSDKTGFSLASTGMDSVVLPADIITAASINTGALTADAFAANALVAATFAASSLDGKGDWNTTVPDAAGTAATEAEVVSAVSGLATATNLATLDTLVDKLARVIIGTVTGAGTGTEVFVHGGVTATITVDVSGNRSAVVYS